MIDENEFNELSERTHATADEIRKLYFEFSSCAKLLSINKDDEVLRSSMDALKYSLEEKRGRLDEMVNKMQELSGFSEEEILAMEEKAIGSVENRIYRSDLSQEALKTTRWIDDELPNALDRIKSIIEPAFLGSLDLNSGLLPDTFLTEPLEIVRGIRLKSQFSQTHRFFQAIAVIEQHLNKG